MAITFLWNAPDTSDSDCTPASEYNRKADEASQTSAALSASIATEDDELSHAFTTIANDPNNADWPDGLYRASINCTTIGGDVTYGLLTLGGSDGAFHRVNSSCTSQESWTQDEGAFSGTGVNVATNTIDPSSGAAGDRFQALIAAANSHMHSAENFAITTNSSSFSEFPEAGTEFTQSVGDGSLTFAGGLTKQPQIPLVGGLTFTGVLARKTQKIVAGVLTFVGALQKKTSRPVAGTLTFTGALVGVKKVFASIAGVLTFSGGLTKKTGKPVSGGLTFAGSLNKQIFRLLSGGLAFAGALSKVPQRLLSGVLTFTGVLTSTKLFQRSIGGVLTFSGTLTKQTRKVLAGELTFSGVVTKLTQHLLSGELTFSGALTKQTQRPLSGGLTFSGGLTKLIKRSLSGVLSFLGGLVSELLPSGPPPDAVVSLTLHTRPMTLTLEPRLAGLTLHARTTSLTLTLDVR